MRALVVLGSSSTLTPSPKHHHHKPHKSTTTTTTRHSLHKPLPVTTPLRSTASRHSSLLSYYADLAAKHSGLGHLQDFASVAEYVIISGFDASHFVAALSAKSVSKGISGNIRRGNLKSVVEALKKLEKLGVSTVNLLDGVAIESLRKECVRMANPGDVEGLVDLLETLAGFSFSIKQLVDPNYIVKLCVDKRNPELAMRFAFILPRERILLCDIINQFGKRRDLDSALIAYQRYKERMTVPNMYVFRTIIDVCGFCGDHMRSRSIYEDLLHRNITPNIYVFNSLMNVNAHDLSYALHLYKSTQNLGVTADVASYNILLKACCLAGRVDLAQDIYREVKQLQSAGQLKLDVFTYCTIIKAFADAKLWKMALKIKEDMLSSGVTPNMFTWSSLISACANAGLVEQAMRLFQEMIMAGCEPNAQCFNIILHACVEAHQYDRAFRLFQFWKGRDVQGTLGENYSGNKSTIPSVEHASEHFVSTVPNPFPNSHHVNFIKKIPFTPTEATYNILMKACGSDYHRAKSLIDEMQKVGLSADQVSWSILIDICGSSNDVDGAVQILKNMRAAGVEPDVVAYTTAIKVCVESKNLDLAFSLFSEMKRYQLKPNLVTYNTLLRARTRYGSLQEIQQSLAIYQDMRKTGYKSNDYYLKQLIEEWCEGVIQDEYQSQDGQTSHKTTELWIPHGLLLERVAAHLQTSVTESLAINIQGLTKVEARIVVLAVLRMIKEEYISGHLVKDDMWITIGLNKLNVHRAKVEFEVKDAIQELLQNELGLEVLSISPRFAERLGRNRKTVSALRRPIVLERLKVKKNSLHDWLQRRVRDIRR